MAERSKAKPCRLSLAETAGSNPAVGMNVRLLRESFVFSGRSLCDRLIPHPEESYGL